MFCKRSFGSHNHHHTDFSHRLSATSFRISDHEKSLFLFGELFQYTRLAEGILVSLMFYRQKKPPDCYPRFLGAVERMWKATISFVLSVRPSVRIEQLGSHWTDFHEIWYLSILVTSDEKIKVTLKSDKNNGYFTWRPTYIFHRISLNYSENEKCFVAD